MLSEYRATVHEVRRGLPSDDILPDADLAVNSAFTIGVNPERIWPWLVQLGKNRAGWYLPYWIERFMPKKRRGYRSVDQTLQNLAVGDKIDDWSGKDVELEVVTLVPTQTLVYRARFRNIDFSWALVLSPEGDNGTRIHSRTRLAPIKHRRPAALFGGFFDRLVAAGLAKGLENRLAES